MKIQKVSQSITSFAGISFVHEEFNKSGLLNLIDNHLGIRNFTGHQHGELFRPWFEIFFCGGEVAEDVGEHLRSTLENIPGNRVASPDTLLRVIKELAKDIIDTFSKNCNLFYVRANKSENMTEQVCQISE
ncbi:MAG: hypothetical protein PHD28_01425 [Proteiniphilum sp.]|nr:hypothetical protein [Proteiniphilum sp.]